MSNKEDTKRPIFKKAWFWIIIVLIIIVIGASGNSSENSTTNAKENIVNTKSESSKIEVNVKDFSKMSKKEIQEWCQSNKIECEITQEYSNKIKKGNFINQSSKANSKIYEGDKITVVYSLGKEPSTEYKNALKKAETYANTMYMSKQGVYDQLVSEYGEKFPKDAAQYAIDNVKADWNKNALEKAKSYQETMSMSKNAIYDQLISKYGEKFTKKQAKYAIEHLDD